MFSQLVPWQFDYSGEKRNVKRTFRRVSCGTARLLGNMGSGGETPLLGRFSSPVAKGTALAEGLLSGCAGGVGRPLPLLPVVELPMAARSNQQAQKGLGRKIASLLHQRRPRGTEPCPPAAARLDPPTPSSTTGTPVSSNVSRRAATNPRHHETTAGSVPPVQRLVRRVPAIPTQHFL